jgi:hypothetical protein
MIFVLESSFYCGERQGSEYFAETVDLVVVGPVHELVLLFELLFHEHPRVAVTGNIANGQVNPFFDDELVVADVGHHYPVPFFRYAGEFIFGLDGIEQDIIGLFRKGKEGQLGIIEEAVDEMKLDKHLLSQQLRPVEQDLMVLEIVDVLHLERRHADLPDDPARSRSKLDIVRRDKGLRQEGILIVLGQNLVGKV